MPFRFFRQLIFVPLLIAPINAQPSTANEALIRALHFADLYNWADAAPAFAEAEKEFSAAGDKRNTLYAKLGLIRSNVERGDQALPLVSAHLADELDNDPLLQNDRQLRMFCLIVKGDIDAETNTASDAGRLAAGANARSRVGRFEMAVSRIGPTWRRCVLRC